MKTGEMLSYVQNRSTVFGYAPNTGAVTTNPPTTTSIWMTLTAANTNETSADGSISIVRVALVPTDQIPRGVPTPGDQIIDALGVVFGVQTIAEHRLGGATVGWRLGLSGGR